MKSITIIKQIDWRAEFDRRARNVLREYLSPEEVDWFLKTADPGQILRMAGDELYRQIEGYVGESLDLALESVQQGKTLPPAIQAPYDDDLEFLLDPLLDFVDEIEPYIPDEYVEEIIGYVVDSLPYFIARETTQFIASGRLDHLIELAAYQG